MYFALTLGAVLGTRSEGIVIVQRRVAGKKHILHLLRRQVSVSARLALGGKMEEPRHEYEASGYGRKGREL